MKDAQSLSVYPPGIPMRRVAQAAYGEEEAQTPRWQLPLYQQPDRPSRAAIASYQASIASERRLSVPHAINILQQADECLEQQPVTDMIHCDACEAPYEAHECYCPYCAWGR